MKTFEMSPEQLAELKSACTATPVMLIGGIDTGKSAQENANDAWKKLGSEMGFDHMTVKPHANGQRWFTAQEKALDLTETENRKLKSALSQKQKIDEALKLLSDVFDQSGGTPIYPWLEKYYRPMQHARFEIGYD